jgi:hypothetical protein
MHTYEVKHPLHCNEIVSKYFKIFKLELYREFCPKKEDLLVELARSCQNYQLTA